jgi:hypothetical protein
MFLNKSKEITEKKIPEVNAISQHFLTPFVEEEKIGSSPYQGEPWPPSIFGRSLFLGEYALEKFFSANHLMPRRHSQYEFSN